MNATLSTALTDAQLLAAAWKAGWRFGERGFIPPYGDMTREQRHRAFEVGIEIHRRGEAFRVFTATMLAEGR